MDKDKKAETGGQGAPQEEDEAARFLAAQKLVKEQSIDDEIWRMDQYDSVRVRYLQRQLRLLHAAIEGVSPEQNVLRILKEIQDGTYFEKEE